MATDVCIFCLDAKENPVSVGCGHTFCRECLKGYVRIGKGTNCPLCRRPFEYTFDSDNDSLFQLLVAAANDDDVSGYNDIENGEDYELDDDYLIDIKNDVGENQNDDDFDDSFDDTTMPYFFDETSDSEAEISDIDFMSVEGSSSSDDGSISLDESYWDDCDMEIDSDDLISEDGNPRYVDSDGDNDVSDDSDDSHDTFLEGIFTVFGELD